MRRTLPQLVRRWRVMALVRRRDPALAALGVTQIEGDLDQPQTLARLSGISDAVIHSAPPPTEGKGDPRTARLLALLQRGKSLPRRLIYISTSGVYGDCGGARVDETRAGDGKVGARGTARRCGTPPAPLRSPPRRACRVSILRAPGIYAGDRLPLERLRRGLPLMLHAEDSHTNHIHAEDLGRACIAALAHGGANRAYNINDDSALAMGEWFDLLADRFQLPRAPRLPREEVRRRGAGNAMVIHERIAPARQCAHEARAAAASALPDGSHRHRRGEGNHMLWVKAFHILFVVSWFAGLFYLPRIFVNLAMVPADSVAERERLLLMAGKLFRFMTPLGVLAIALGLWLWFGYGFTGGWLHAKTALVIGLAAYHAWCGMLLAEFRTGSSIKSHVWFRCLQRGAGAGLAGDMHPRRGQALLICL
jgi:uncharacterized integral membrane protein (TIGR00701 family)